MTEYHATKLSLFKIPDAGKNDVQMCELHVWGWLKNNESALGKRGAITAYLVSLGFVPGENRVTNEDIQILTHAVEHYSFLKRRNLLGAQA